MLKTTDIDYTAPAKLIPIQIPKPWGQEIWYSGIESRGESCVEIANTRIPLSDYLSGIGLPEVLLLKVLDPSPVSVVGDLYFEVHEKKREVYVVTHIDPIAWPDGKGQIRFGMNQEHRSAYENDDDFRVAYLQAVRAYEGVRRSIDETKDTQQDGPRSQLIEKEQIARKEMDNYTAIESLAVGDVVSVPTWTPHALQHGVRVVEFQTPVYERLIVSFAQKVLTQGHWDTKQAVERMTMEAPTTPVFEPVSDGVERIARFDDFNVWRIDRLNPHPVELPRDLPYAVVMNLSGSLNIKDLQLGPEEAALVPVSALHHPIQGQRFLIAAPGL
ncbi:MAG: hypothetical protein GKR90_19935 [Pseudomonadales bacterium]|nr:hypothetical protein [Pseudomonadales bacterium]